MSYKVKTADFEGPFQLLLHLVSQRKVDIGNISIAEVADQYLAYLGDMRNLDMDVASDFIEVAASLLALKASSLLPHSSDYEVDEEFETLEPEQAREILISRLVAYKQFRNAAAALGSRMENEGRMHARQAGLEAPFLSAVPDYLEGVNLENLALICAGLAARREEFLMEARHIAARPIPVEGCLEEMRLRLSSHGTLTFAQLLEGRRDSAAVVVSFLAMLELFHRGMIAIEQQEGCGTITLSWIDQKDWAPALPAEDDEASPVDEYLEKQRMTT
ncbi:MAG: segregation/condensation protein A [Coriobacteriales bacterium]|jgi:segregation and condensation protein A|nr:segregation/condensation protein A [Coriobacteriales bacterium]